MDAEARGLERLIEGLGNDRLLAMIRTVIIAEEEFLERERDADALRFTAALGDFSAGIRGARLPNEILVEINERAGRYGSFFGQYVRTTEELRAIKKEYLRAVQTVDPLLEKLYVGSLERVAAKRRAIERSARRLSLPVIAVGGVVLVVTALFSLAIAVTVSRSVVESKAFAERIAAGDLGGRLVLEGRNEFFTLATALNTMAQVAARGRCRQGEQRRCAAGVRGEIPVLCRNQQRLDLGNRSRGEPHLLERAGCGTSSGSSRRSCCRASTLDLLHPEDVPRVRELLRTSRSSGSGWRGIVLRWRHKDGTYRWIESNAVAVRDAQGCLVGFRGVDRDITERRRLEAELIKTQKLEAIGTLAGGIAHDFNNLLQGLFGYISLAKMNLDRRDKAGEMLEQAEKALSTCP